ncbi:hypothetical protein TSOC_005376 [Tetrabaena socialis]|uniref:Potassium channel domain-containing protein n=1 Tax=Tetrabaena socialis TaxID=47790 RepID=A0A2J8A6F3_9CHLO|nr:hypothetical protein TSOC_005376 [Tetrabaena socialis]|eukprot:PNH08104.1 hypothetical protein TSOC_005376 [Tetrabaena socialis]
MAAKRWRETHRLDCRAGNGQLASSIVLLVGALLLLVAAPSVAIDAPALPVPTTPVTLCMIDGAPELAQSSTNLVQDNELLSLTQAKARLHGLSIDLISAVFDQILGWPINIRYTTGFSKTLYRTREGDGCNISISNIFKAAHRETCNAACLVPDNSSALGPEEFEPFVCCLDFSHTYFSGGWSLMSKQTNGASVNYVDVFFQRDIVHALAVTVIGMFVVAHLIWIFEARVYGKRETPTYTQFRPKYLDGLKDGTWFAGSTVLGDVGAGMKLPVTPAGRLLAIIWVMFGLFVLSFVTSVISSTLTEAK